MALLSYNPRVVDDDFFQLFDDLSRPLYELARPFYGPRERRGLGRANLGQLSPLLGDTEVQNTDQEYRICLNLSHYKPEEVKITLDKNRVLINCKHEEKEDKYGFVSRQMTRMYTLPPDVDPKSVTSTMNNQGLLCIKAAKQALEAPKEIPIPVEFKG